MSGRSRGHFYGGRGGYSGRGSFRSFRGSRFEYSRGGGGWRGSSRGRSSDRELLDSLNPEAKLALTKALVATVLKKSDSRDDRDYRDRDMGSRFHRDTDRSWRSREGGRDRRYIPDYRRYEGRSLRDEGRGYHGRDRPRLGSPRYRSAERSLPHKRGLSPMEDRRSPSKHVRREDSDKSDHEVSASKEEKHGAKEDTDAEGKGDSSGVQVTIRTDGERDVNAEENGQSTVSGKVFIDLKCPHCPGHRSITFKEYRFHVRSAKHVTNVYQLARRYSLVLRKIRFLQRKEQKELEDKWAEKEPEVAKTAISRYCNVCKLAFKCPGNDIEGGEEEHQRSKLHKKQVQYLERHCGLCHRKFASFLEYEHHLASIAHIRQKTESLHAKGSDSKEKEPHDEEEDLDVDQFFTLDSVGEEGLETLDAEEDDEEIGVGDESDRKEKTDDENRGSDGEADQQSDYEGKQDLGREYLQRIEAYFCKLCFKVIRADESRGSRAVQRHCQSAAHIKQYYNLHPEHEPEEAEKKVEEESDGHDISDIDLKGLDQLKEIMTDLGEEIEGDINEKSEDEEKEEDDLKKDNCEGEKPLDSEAEEMEAEEDEQGEQAVEEDEEEDDEDEERNSDDHVSENLLEEIGEDA